MITDIINKRIKEKGLKKKAISKKINMSDDLLGKTLNGKRRMKADELVALCRELDLTFDDFRSA